VGLEYIQPEKLREDFKHLGRSISLTTGSFSMKSPGDVAELDWNHMDKEHRPWIHNTYTEALHIAHGPDFWVSLTRMSFFGIPFFVQVTDLRIKPGLFYQSYTFFAFIHVVSLTRSQPGLVECEWHIVSHAFLKPLHWVLNRKLKKLNAVQNEEDIPIRKRRTDLREKGYRFIPEIRDYQTSNRQTPSVQAPLLQGSHRLSLGTLNAQEIGKFSVGPIDLLIRLNGDRTYSIWNAVCPHEGGPLEEGKICEGAIQCPWHGLKFQAATLHQHKKQTLLGGLLLTLENNNQLVVCQNLNYFKNEDPILDAPL
jgi:hypothetical protein